MSPACAHCYAETLAVNRMGLRGDTGVWGEGAARRITAESTWRKPLRWERLALEGLLPNGKENPDGHRPRVFCASMADVFEPRHDLEAARWRLFDLIAATPSLDWLLLTKRPDVAKTVLVDGRRATPDEVDDGYELGWVPPLYYDGRVGTESGDLGSAPLPNVWLGTSIENSRFTWRADVLREIPAVVHFISAEPLLGSLYDSRPLARSGSAESMAGDDATERSTDSRGRAPLDLHDIEWLIVGGESGGRGSRPTHPDWVRELRDHATSTDTAFHFKQWGSYAPRGFVSGHLDVDSRPEKDADGFRSFYYGATSKAAGKLLDGREWCEFPRVAVPA